MDQAIFPRYFARLSMTVGIGLMLTACAATGPVSSPEYDSLVAAANPAAAGNVVTSGPGNWYPNTNGFTNAMSTFLAPMTPPIPGVVVIGTNAVVFEQWDPDHHQYVTMKLEKYTDLMDEHVDTFGLNARLVLKKTDYTVDSFDFSTAGGQLINRTKAHEVGAYLADHLPAGVGHKENEVSGGH
jgi:hypothetical protein